MLSRLDWKPPVTLKPRPHQRTLTAAAKRRIVDHVCNILREGEPTRFALEGFCRHGVRQHLCLAGWGWQRADDMAATVLSSAFAILGAKRPTWQEGQPEWTQPGIIAQSRTRCVRCGWKLPEGHQKYCSPQCAANYKADIARKADRMASNAKQAAYYAQWSAKQPLQPCKVCETPFRPKKPGQVLCSKRCVVSNLVGRR
jgi:predicted nucleic acid-binding Zn ribbon protein